MIRDCDGWLGRLKLIERESLAMQLAAIRLQEHTARDPTIFKDSGIASRDLKIALRNLESTYLIRLFAEFEAGLRSYWASIKRSQPRARDLVDGLASRHGIRQPLVAATHAVREYRNSLVHDQDAGPTAIPLSMARSTLCRFFSRLPDQWS